MTGLDRFIQRWRMHRAAPFVPEGGRVIDVGAHAGELFESLGARLREGFGIEPLARAARRGPNFMIVPGYFPAARPAGDGWDAVTMLAVLEHVPRDQQAALVAACHELLRPGGRVIITVPGPAVDPILAVLSRLRLIDGIRSNSITAFSQGTRCAFLRRRGSASCTARASNSG